MSKWESERQRTSRTEELKQNFFLANANHSLQRWNSASHALMCERKALPKPCPSLAPLTRPAMSVTLRKAGTLLQRHGKVGEKER